MKQYKFLFLLAIVFSYCPLQAQTIEPATINASSLYYSNATLQVDGSIGEMTLVSTVKKPNLIVTQGLLQPNLAIPDNITENYFSTNGISVYPNPTTSDLNIIAQLKEGGDFTIRLTDMLGKIIFSENMKAIVGENNISVSLNAIAQGNYVLLVNYQSTQSQLNGNQNFKIQKLN